jgi:hypothetical protein
MRVSTIPDTEGFHPMVAKNDIFKVILDSVDVTNKYFMFTVDDNEGFIDVYVVDSKKNILTDDEGLPKTDRLFGKVELKFKGGYDVQKRDR